MPHYDGDPATLTEAEWDELIPIFASYSHGAALELLRKGNNTAQRAGDLFSPEDVYSRGRDHVNTALRKAKSVFRLCRVNYVHGTIGTPREDHLLALVRKPQ